MGWDVNVHVNLRQQLMLRTRGVGGGGVGWDVNVHVNLRQQLMLRTRGVGGVGWDVNVHVNLRQQLMLRTRTPGRHRKRSSKLCETCSCCEETEKNWSHMFLVMMILMMMMMMLMMMMLMMMMLMMMMRMMMMNMTQIRLVNSATKFRHGMDKFYQPNSGLRSSRSLDEAIYTLFPITNLYRSLDYQRVKASLPQEKHERSMSTKKSIAALLGMHLLVPLILGKLVLVSFHPKALVETEPSSRLR